MRVSARLLALATAGCGGAAEVPAGSTGASWDWEQLAPPPISGRGEALVASLGETIVVAGGWDRLCPPQADCVLPDTPPFADGAAYDVPTGRWRRISDAPMGLRATVTAVLQQDIYALSHCEGGASCPAGEVMLRYRSDADTWDQLPLPDETSASGFGLVAVAGGLVAFRQSDEQGSSPDYRWVAAEERWIVLPDDPLPPVFDRFVVEYAGRLLLFGSPIAAGSGTSRTKLAAAYDPNTGAWQELAASGTLGFQVWRAGSLLYLNPHFRGDGGGVYDPAANLWSPLPDPPYHDLAGVIGQDEASYAYASGWVLDTRTGDWLEIGARPNPGEVHDESIAVGPAQSLLVFGGQSWLGGEGQLVNDTWLWRPPPTTR